MDSIDIVKNLREIDIMEDFESKESTLLVSMKEMEIKIDMAKNRLY
jgi:hypothetical protein